MKYIIKLNMILVLVIVQGHFAKAQYVIKEADAQYDLYNYQKAIELYTAAYQKKKTLHSVERLAESYRLTRDYKQAESWFAILTAMEGAKSDATLKYAEALRHNAKYAEAKVQFKKYADMEKETTVAQRLLWSASCDSAIKWMQNPKFVTLKNEQGLNSPQSDWGAIKYGNGLVFTSDRTNVSAEAKASKNRPFLKFDGSKLPDRNTYGWTGNDYLRLYEKSTGNDTVGLFPIDPGTNYHVGNASFTPDVNEVFFTLTRIPNRIERKKGAPTTVNIELYSSKKVSGVWQKPVAFRYNAVDSYSVGDPLVTDNGNTLYFVSNMPGGKGGTDIYKSTRNADSTWSDALNLSQYNSSGNERTPMFDAEGNLYFSSDGFPGMGGLDIFKAVNNGVQNMGYPLNSADDDFAFTLHSKNEGYLSSNRDGGMGSDDIYSFVEKLILAFKLEGKVFDKQSNEPLANAIVSLTASNGNPLKVATNSDGSFKFDLDANMDYSIQGEKTGYRVASPENLTTKGLTTSTVLRKDLYLEKISIGKAIRLENIYYDFDKSNIRPDAAIELDKLVKIMTENPTIWIELGSHTDSRGNDEYNQSLSQRRANSAVQYIIDKGIEKSRITAKGYGESRLVNGCSNGVKCSVADHQLNRRTEFTITKQ
ncbi:flagellar motor protein MotB [Pedobacter sp. G11]|uniref:OmpA family protein n=1 Tax=Pedobacter sp. G11 TaxID=2482728 RepID=UPI000F5E4DB3|nr:OmpA family protein [Pedobacter sp. G11]AZI26012.1 flagellar motor protein MotB [Pedobacter sp. G11]